MRKTLSIDIQEEPKNEEKANQFRETMTQGV